MAVKRQQVLFLCLVNPELSSKTIAWALYDGASSAEDSRMETGDSAVPPYASVLDAMRDGWKVLQAPQLPYFMHGHENETGHLPWEYLLEREVETDG
ncbi:hypothetical protein [Paenibacillus nasutitermitis]|uniref:Uncharacterized protein n=1 Tax=Paenibacillus nasutitermitis TaxID=1652958 RepID=A0A917DPF9_9BACL|nr:hypothetical protein [Paenibacillus nasutitermitis]GGD53893.1 hypothetical protein GCM10010911_09270 [Paenibacillus nasutitermitis]